MRKKAFGRAGVSVRIALALVFLATLAMPAMANSSPSLADAYKVIASKKLVDLTHTFGPARRSGAASARRP